MQIQSNSRKELADGRFFLTDIRPNNAVAKENENIIIQSVCGPEYVTDAAVAKHGAVDTETATLTQLNTVALLRHDSSIPNDSLPE